MPKSSMLSFTPKARKCDMVCAFAATSFMARLSVSSMVMHLFIRLRSIESRKTLTFGVRECPNKFAQQGRNRVASHRHGASDAQQTGRAGTILIE